MKALIRPIHGYTRKPLSIFIFLGRSIHSPVTSIHCDSRDALDDSSRHLRLLRRSLRQLRSSLDTLDAIARLGPMFRGISFGYQPVRTLRPFDPTCSIWVLKGYL